AACALASGLAAGFPDLGSSGINKGTPLVDARPGVGVALHADGLARTFARAGVGLGALAAHGQPAQVSHAAVTLDGLQPLQVQTDFTAEIAFGDIYAVLDCVNDLRQLLFVQILGADGRVNREFV